MTTNKPIVLVIGMGPTLKIINTIKTIAHLILAELETVFIVVQQFDYFDPIKISPYRVSFQGYAFLETNWWQKMLDWVDAQFSTLNRR
ncbi:hypothetical protein MGMO_136c00060 [Methyloglobulus morosus KoM1]|uniref:Uncharacterized protein n=1 Tax=Methyloglobulus morosus KoM1 TaxID=1116472 RepID=V5BT02_9GAMM|nr:hypothetical protein [Methyloglobulus morosus]ESS69327.1 hypothetical protein MGMO_136c00060 [Methyloglobulus morosus KoM1]